MGFGPQVVDLDADGNDDIISGSYWPGHIYLFRGEGERKFAKGARLTDASGAFLHGGGKWASDDKPDMDSLAAAPWMVDFDADGDLDLLIGNIAGHVILIPNEGTASAPKFSTKRIPLMGGRRQIRVAGGDAGPVTADWDGDGKWDLIVGAGDGSVMFCRNVGEKGKPLFEAPRALIPRSPRGYDPLQPGVEPKAQGGRTKVCVADYDGDGHLDLLVGDFASVLKAEPKLTSEQIKQRDRLRAESDKVAKEYSALFAEHRGDREKAKQATAKLRQRLNEIYQELRPLVPGNDTAGWVWFYKRKAPASSRNNTLPKTY